MMLQTMKLRCEKREQKAGGYGSVGYHPPEGVGRLNRLRREGPCLAVLVPSPSSDPGCASKPTANSTHSGRPKAVPVTLKVKALLAYNFNLGLGAQLLGQTRAHFLVLLFLQVHFQLWLHFL